MCTLGGITLLGTISTALAYCAQPDTSLEPGLDNHFTLTDYVVLLIMLVVSCAIGFLVGMSGEKQTTSDDFLLGSSNMGTLPMALSLAAR